MNEFIKFMNKITPRLVCQTCKRSNELDYNLFIFKLFVIFAKM